MNIQPLVDALAGGEQRMVGPAISAQNLHEVCTNGLKVPDLADMIAWKSALLENVSEFHQNLIPGFFRLMKDPPEGFGFATGRAVLATLHLRELVESKKKNLSPWHSPALSALDVIANSVALWRLWPCKCGRPLRSHAITIFDRLVTATQKDEQDAFVGYQIQPIHVFGLDCGRFFRAPDWFIKTRDLPYPDTPEAVMAVRPLAVEVGREWLWRCLREYYCRDASLLIPDDVSKAFNTLVGAGRLSKGGPEEDLGRVISDLAKEIKRGVERYSKAGVAGAGIGLMWLNGNLIFAEA